MMCHYIGCNFTVCRGQCCYDGVYVTLNEEKAIKTYIQMHPNDFHMCADDYFTDGNWRDRVQGRKTTIRNHVHTQPFPPHFTQTICHKTQLGRLEY